MPRKQASRKEEASFESLYAALEDRAGRLEAGNLPLEEAITLYEEAASIADQLRDILQAAELRIRTVQRRLDGDSEELRELEAEYEPEYHEDEDL